MKTQRESDEVARLDGVGSAGAGARAWSPARTRWRRAMRGCFLSLTGTEREAWPRCLAISGGPTSPTTTRFPKDSSSPSSTGPRSPAGSAAPRTRAVSARVSSAGYNTEHHHSALGWLIPEDMHYGRDPRLTEAGQHVLDAAYTQHPERFAGKTPQAPSLSEAAWITPPKLGGEKETRT